MPLAIDIAIDRDRELELDLDEGVELQATSYAVCRMLQE